MNVFIELTNIKHGGNGWELGNVLWSPADSPWNIMNEPEDGDLIFHSVKMPTGHKLWGKSKVKKKVETTTNSPEVADRWSGFESYYRIELDEYEEFSEKIPLQQILDDCKEELIKLVPQQSFYTEKDNKFKTAQKYLAAIKPELFEVISNYLSLDVEIDAQAEWSTNRGEQNPGRVETKTSRIVRDTVLSNQIKNNYGNKCQICGTVIGVTADRQYSEGHHIRPLALIHGGPDVLENIIVLCPNHHVEFDRGSIAIHPETKLVVHSSELNIPEFKLNYKRDNISTEYLEYHYKNIFNK